MRRCWPLAALILLCGCPPPVYFDILNNTGTELAINTPKSAIRLQPGGSIELGERELAQRETDPQGNLTLPVLRLEHLGHKRDYYLPLRVEDGWHRTWHFRIQVDSDLAIRIVRPKDRWPVPVDYAQPQYWPLVAINR